MNGEPTDNFTKAKGIADSLKSIVGLIMIVVPLVSSWYDPTFWGLLWLNPIIAAEGFKISVFASFLLVAYVVLTHHQELKKNPHERSINLTRNLIALIVISLTFVVLINVTATYQANNPPSSTARALWARHLLQAQYILFVALTVFFIARIVLRLFPRIGARDTSMTKDAV